VGSHIFISHSSKDQKVARTICTALENRGLTCWEYSRNIQPGQNFQEQIVRAIRAAKIMVLVFTANANSSNEIKKELAIASQNNLVVIPVRIEDVIPNEAFAYEFATRQWIDLFEDWESSIARLVELIATTSDDQPPGGQAGLASAGDAAAPPAGKVFKTVPAPATGAASFMQQPGSRWAMIFGVAVIVVAGIAYGVATLRRQPASVSGTPTTGSPTQSVPAAATKTGASDPLRLDLVTDCDRLAAAPVDPQRPPSVAGIAPDKIDIVPALTACNAAMRQYPDVVRFVFQAGRIAAEQKDYLQASQLFEKAAAAGSAVAITNLGNLYFRGDGVPQDYAKARQLFEKGAAAGISVAMNNLGSLYENGNGVPKDYVEARKWFEEAAAAGQPNAMNALGSIYYNGSGVPKDYAQARQWYQKAAAAGQANAMTNLGLLYNNGNGVAQDYAAARTWYEKAAAAGQANAMTNLGLLYYNGNGVAQDYAAARTWYEKAAAAGSSVAMFSLGLLYQNGHGVPQDYAAARTWYVKAAAAGYEPANAMIKQIDASTQQSASVEAGSECRTVVGSWSWKYLDQTAIVTLKANGTGSATNGNTPTWTCGGRTVIINWSQGQVDKMTLSSDGKRMTGTGWRGISVLGIRR